MLAGINIMPRWPMASAATSALRVAFILTFAYLCAGELLPLPAIKASKLLQGWAVQQVVLLAGLSCLAVLLATADCSSGAAPRIGCNRITDAAWLLALLNVVPVAAAIVTTHWVLLSDNCPVVPGRDCGYVAIVLDVIGLISARLSRLDLGISLLLAAHGESSWLLGATAGYLGYAEAMPLHRNAGWWCAAQSALHSLCYLAFYFADGGLASLWLFCFPAPLANGKLNRLGLVNFLGLLAFALTLALVLPACPPLRRRFYHVFQRLHLPLAALFVLCCALHDLPILLFAVPGLATWYLEWRGRGGHHRCARQRLAATARLLPGTSGPWIELLVDCSGASGIDMTAAPRGQWVSLRVVPLGRESHPLSVGLPLNRNAAELSLLVSAQAGDWTRALVALSRPPSNRFEVEVSGPYPAGGGRWSLCGDAGSGVDGQREPALLLLAGGTGVNGWLPMLAATGDTAAGHRRFCHLVVCVQNEADYRALVERLPSNGSVDVTVYVTRADAEVRSTPLTTRPHADSVASTAPGDDVLAESRQRHCSRSSSSSSSSRGRRSKGSSSSSSVVSLVAALVGLLVGYHGWKYLADILGLSRLPPDEGWVHTTLAGYTLTRRCLPIALIVVCMLVVAAACSRVFAYYAVPCTRRRRCCTQTELGAVSPRRVRVSPLQQPQQPLFSGSSSSSSTQEVTLQVGGLPGTEAVAESGGGQRTVRSGRPDLDALVHAAAAAAASSGTSHLVVAACGPPALVAASRTAVAAARKEYRDVHLEFSGGDSRW